MTRAASAPNQFALLASRRFLPFFVTQFLGALNDNVFKNALLIVLAYRGGSLFGLHGAILVNVAAAVFILPYVFLSASAGQWADKYEKTRLMRAVKVAEIGIMLIGAAGFMWNRTDLLFLALLLMGCHSTVFGPAKYALLPQQLAPAELVGGNALVETGTFIAILLGTLLGGGLVASSEVGVVPVSLATLAIAVLGYLASRAIPPAPSMEPGLRLNHNPLGETLANLRLAARDRTLFLALLANSWFWFYGAVFLTQFPSWAHDSLHGNESVTVVLLTALSVGIGVGSLLCERLSRRGLNLGLVPLGLSGMVVFAWLLPLTAVAVERSVEVVHGVRRVGADGLVSIRDVYLTLSVPDFIGGPGALTIAVLVGMGISAGLYTVPLYTLIQSRSDPRQVSRMIAANNVLNAVAMVLSSVLAIALFALGASIANVFQACAAATLVFLLVLCVLAPEYRLGLNDWLRRSRS